MKRNQPVNWVGLCTKTNCILVLHETFKSVNNRTHALFSLLPYLLNT